MGEARPTDFGVGDAGVASTLKNEGLPPVDVVVAAAACVAQLPSGLGGGYSGATSPVVPIVRGRTGCGGPCMRPIHRVRGPHRDETKTHFNDAGNRMKEPEFSRGIIVISNRQQYHEIYGFVKTKMLTPPRRATIVPRSRRMTNDGGGAGQVLRLLVRYGIQFGVATVGLGARVPGGH